MPITCPQCRAQMPDNVAFCPGCGCRMWVPGQDAKRPAASPPVIRMPGIPPVSVTPVGVPGQFKDNLLAALAYITFIPATIFVLIEPFRRNRFIRFHSFQSIFLTIATIVIAIALRILYSVFTLIPVVGYLMAWLALAVAVLGWGILWLVLLVKALQGQTFRLLIGSLAEKA
jgi:uncharacterized membrane protein